MRTVAKVYVVAISAIGVGLLVVLNRTWPRVDGVVVVLAGCTLLGELRPIQVPVGRELTVLTTSTTFAFALSLVDGPGVAALVWAVSAVVADLIARKEWWKVTFNASTYVASVAVGDALFQLLRGDARWGDTTMFASWGDVSGALVAGAAFFATNLLLLAVGIGLAQRLSPWRILTDDFAFQLMSNMALLALGPVTVIVLERSPWMLPLLLVPLAVAYQSAVVSIQKEHQALHDALTGLANRVLFRDRLADAIKDATRHRGQVGVLLLDLDRFKDVNDTLGHQVGDQVLRTLGPRLQAAIRPEDTIARLGGDEFAIIVRDLGDPGDCRSVAERLHTCLNEPILVDDFQLEVGASIGITTYPANGDDADTLIQRADVAMYEAKSRQSGPVVYEPGFDNSSPLRLALVRELRIAIDREELTPYFQPIVDLDTGRVSALEALVRWPHPERGLMPPDQFIPLAEQTGLIRPLTHLMLRASAAAGAAWQAKGHDVGVSVNLSTLDLYDDDIVGFILDTLHETGLDPQLFKLEITESGIMRDFNRSVRVLERLRGIGVDLAIDDFGTGQSSLAYLSRLPVNTLKIDKSFITRLVEDQTNTLITGSTIDLATRLGLKVVAEGVETVEAWDLLRAMGCDHAQGYYISRPLPKAGTDEWLRDEQVRSLASDCSGPGAPPRPTRAPRAPAGRSSRTVPATLS